MAFHGPLVFHALFWLAWAALHAGAWMGSKRGGFLPGILADSAHLFFQCGCALGILAACALVGGWIGRGEAALPWAGAWAMRSLSMGAARRAGPWGVPAGARLREGALRLLQANVEGCSNESGWGFDAVAICEMWDGPLPAPEGMRLVVGAVEGRCDAAIYSRLPVLGCGVAGPEFAGWAQAVWARLDWHGLPVTLVSVHTRAPINIKWNAQRDAFLQGLAAFVQGLPEGEPVVLAGDWNITPAGARFQEFMASGAFNQEPDPLRPTWRADLARFGTGFRIDRVIGARGAFVRSWKALPKGRADHLASASEIVFLAD